MTSFPVEEATIEGIHAAMLAGELQCRTLVETYLRRIEALDRDGPRLNAIVSVCGQALGRAEELDEELAATRQLSGPLHGIPLLVKDCIETVDAPTTFGSIATADYMARQDAEVVRRLRTAGSVILAKTTLCDFGAGWFSYSSRSGDTKNPYPLERDSGGSSAGSAAAVVANFATAAVGTDCGARSGCRRPSAILWAFVQRWRGYARTVRRHAGPRAIPGIAIPEGDLGGSRG